MRRPLILPWVHRSLAGIREGSHKFRNLTISVEALWFSELGNGLARWLVQRKMPMGRPMFAAYGLFFSPRGQCWVIFNGRGNGLFFCFLLGLPLWRSMAVRWGALQEQARCDRCIAEVL